MAGTETKRIIELTEASTVQNGDFIAVDSNARGTKKVSTDTLATSAALTAETNARTGADEQMSERMDGIEEQTALIQNPTKTVSGALCSFTDGADMPMVACTAEIVPKQSGSGTPSPDNVRTISGWESVEVWDDPKYGGTVAWNQLVQNGDFADTSIWRKSGTTLTASNNVGSVTQTNENGLLYLRDLPTVVGHKYFITISVKLNSGSNKFVVYGLGGYAETPVLRSANSDAWQTLSTVFSLVNANPTYMYIGDKSGTNLSYDIKNVMLIDLTQLFGSTVADYVYGLEQSQAGAGVEWFKNLFPKDYYEYNAGEETCVSAVNGDAYIHNTTTFDETVYGGTLDVVSGVLTVTHGYQLFDGSSDEDIRPYAGTRITIGITDYLSPAVTIKDTITANYLQTVNKSAQGTGVGYISGSDVGTSQIMINLGSSTLDEAKSYLASNPLQVVYPLAQAQTYQLTPTEVKTLLGENNVWVDSGDVEITYRRDISIVLENLENALSGSNSLNTMMMSAPTESTAEEPTEDEAEDDMR